MPRGSKIGERRGGRQRGTPNRRTVLVDRILALTSERPTMSACQFIDVLIRDRELPADIRIEVACEFLRAGTRSVGVKAARSSADKRRKAKSADPWPERSGTAKSMTLDILFGLAQDATAHPDQRRKAACQVAQHFLPKKPGTKRWWQNAPADEYGFAVTPQIAAEYRDTKMELRRLARSAANSPAITRKAAKMQERLKAILRRLECPCPSVYGKDQLAEDFDRLLSFLHQRDGKIALSEKDSAEEARRRARCDSFLEGPESAARQRLSLLTDKERRFRNRRGARLTWKERTDLRFLRLLYPQQSTQYNPDYELHYQPLRDAPLASNGNLYPPDSKLAPLKEGEIEEFVDVPPYIYGHPAYPGHRWYWEPPAQTDFVHTGQMAEATAGSEVKISAQFRSASLNVVDPQPTTRNSTTAK
jgi:hypothetical protein